MELVPHDDFAGVVLCRGAECLNWDGLETVEELAWDFLSGRIRDKSARWENAPAPVVQDVRTAIYQFGASESPDDLVLVAEEQDRVDVWILNCLFGLIPDVRYTVIWDEPFNEVSSAGGIATATQVAYWMSLLAVAVRMNDTSYPGFLMIDSPRLAVSSSEDISGQMYSRFVTQVGVVEGRLQFVIADNEMPSNYVREFTEYKFSYGDPTVSTVPHPGPAAVSPIVVSVAGEDEGAD